MNLPRVTPNGGIDVDGQYLPTGTVVGMNPYVVHRNPDISGKCEEQFPPDRWLEEVDNGDRERYYFAFGSWSRICLGKNLS